MMMRTNTRNYRQRTLQAQVPKTASPSALRYVLLIMLACSMGLACVWLRSATEKTSKTLQKKRREFALKRKETENLRLELETFKSGRHIYQAVAQMNLQLREPLPGQVRRVANGKVTDSAPTRERQGLLARN
jgi:cell division protein FtsL